MKSVCLLVILTFILSQSAWAQPVPASGSGVPKYWIERDGGFFGDEYVTDGKMQMKPSWSGFPDLEPMVKGHAELEPDYKVYKNWKTAFTISYFASMGLLLGSIFTSDINTKLSMGLVGIGGVFYSIHAQFKARQYMFRTINKANGVAEPSVTQITRGSMHLASANSPLLGVSFEF